MENEELNDNQKDTYLEYSGGEVIFTEGSQGKEVYLIVSGNVEVSQRIGGQDEVIATLGKGDFFGEMAPLTDESRFATISAIGNVIVKKLSLDEMFWNMQNDPKLMQDVCFRLAKRLKDTTSQLRIMFLRRRAGEEEDTRSSKVSYLQKKITKQDEQIERLNRHIELLKSSSVSKWRKWFTQPKRRWIAGIVILLILIIIHIVAIRLFVPEHWAALVRILPLV